MKNKLKKWAEKHPLAVTLVGVGGTIVAVSMLLNKHAENEAAKDLGYGVLDVLESGHTLTVTCPFETEITL